MSLFDKTFFLIILLKHFPYHLLAFKAKLLWLIKGKCWCIRGFSGGASGKEPICQCRRLKRLGLNPWVGKIPWRRARHKQRPWWTTVHGVTKSQTRLKWLSSCSSINIYDKEKCFSSLFIVTSTPGELENWKGSSRWSSDFLKLFFLFQYELLQDIKYSFLWYPGPSLVAQLVKNLPAIRETLVWFLGREDPLEDG